MGTTSRCLVNVHHAEWAFPSGSIWLLANEQFRETPRYEADNKETQQRGREISYPELYGTYVERCSLPGVPGRQGADERHYEIVHKRCHEFAHCSADDNGDCQGDDILLQQESLEITPHAYLCEDC